MTARHVLTLILAGLGLLLATIDGGKMTGLWLLSMILMFGAIWLAVRGQR